MWKLLGFIHVVRCQRGYVSKTGLEPCFPCPRGYFQTLSGQSGCVQCPGGVKTVSVASTALSHCQGISKNATGTNDTIPTTDLVINECFTEPCTNNASCITVGHGYVCQCKKGWTGQFFPKSFRKLTTATVFILCIKSKIYIHCLWQFLGVVIRILFCRAAYFLQLCWPRASLWEWHRWVFVQPL